MRPILLLAFMALLTACRPEESVPETTVPTTVTEAELLAAVDRTPHPLPDLVPAALGEAGTLTGPASPRFVMGQAVFLGWPSPEGALVPGAGHIAEQGRVKVHLPPEPDLRSRERPTALEWVQEFNIVEPCAVDTLQVSSGQESVRLTRVDVTARNPELNGASGVGDALAGPSDLRLATSPVEAFVNVWPYAVKETKEVSDRTGFLLHADGDVWLRGERRCVFPYVTRLEEAEQYNLFVNLKLRRGWNVVRVQLDGSVPRGQLKVTELVVTGGAADFAFQPDGRP